MATGAIDTVASLLAERGLRARAVGTSGSRKLIAAGANGEPHTIVCEIDGKFAAVFEDGEPPEPLGTGDPATAAAMITRMLTLVAS